MFLWIHKLSMCRNIGFRSSMLPMKDSQRVKTQEFSSVLKKVNSSTVREFRGCSMCVNVPNNFFLSASKPSAFRLWDRRHFLEDTKLTYHSTDRISSKESPSETSLLHDYLSPATPPINIRHSFNTRKQWNEARLTNEINQLRNF